MLETLEEVEMADIMDEMEGIYQASVEAYKQTYAGYPLTLEAMLNELKRQYEEKKARIIWDQNSRLAGKRI